jgi:hypothetical protein
MQLFRRTLYVAAALITLAAVYQLGTTHAQGQGSEYVVDMTSNLVLTNHGRVFVRLLQQPNLPENWREWGAIDTGETAVAMVEFRGDPFPVCNVITTGGNLYQIADDGSGVRVRSQGNVIGVWGKSSGKPKVIKPGEEEAEQKEED